MNTWMIYYQICTHSKYNYHKAWNNTKKDAKYDLQLAPVEQIMVSPGNAWKYIKNNTKIMILFMFTFWIFNYSIQFN